MSLHPENYCHRAPPFSNPTMHFIEMGAMPTHPSRSTTFQARRGWLLRISSHPSIPRSSSSPTISPIPKSPTLEGCLLLPLTNHLQEQHPPEINMHTRTHGVSHSGITALLRSISGVRFNLEDRPRSQRATPSSFVLVLRASFFLLLAPLTYQLCVVFYSS